MSPMSVQRAPDLPPLTVPPSEPAMNTRVEVADIHQDMLRAREATDSQNRVVSDVLLTSSNKY